MKKTNLSGSALIDHDLRLLINQSRPGVKLPSENAVAAKYNVARMTVSKVFHDLAACGLIERRRGSGSYVQGVKTITFLVPSPDFLNRPGYSSSTHMYFAGVLRAAAEMSVKVETLTATLDNDPNHIDFRQFDHIDEHSLVVVPSNWFASCFKLLSERRARVALLDSQARCYGSSQYTVNWLRLIADRRAALKTLLNKLRQNGSRRPAIATHFILTRNIPLSDIHTVRSLGSAGEGLVRIRLPKDVVGKTAFQKRSEIRKVLHKYYRKYNFDALIIDPATAVFGSNINTFCNLPPELPVCAMHVTDSRKKTDSEFCNCQVPAEKMGYDSVGLLLESSRSQGTIMYDYIFENLNLLDCI